ncbi:hypothetical protein GCM10010327_25630 [Streptomyces nitrosporeus]|nr:hypothetical protein GCM10010327_25630 [Streptomyces nitrosporeus]
MPGLHHGGDVDEQFVRLRHESRFYSRAGRVEPEARGTAAGGPAPAVASAWEGPRRPPRPDGPAPAPAGVWRESRSSVGRVGERGRPGEDLLDL